MNKTPHLLISLILIPLLILGWLSIQLEQNQQQLVSHQLEKLLEDRLATIDQQFQQHFRNLEVALNDEAQALFQSKDPDYRAVPLRKLIKTSPYIEQIFILDRTQQLQFPQYSSATQRETAFLDASKTLLSTPGLFEHHTEQTDPAAPLAQPSIQEDNSYSAISAQLKSAPATELSIPRSRSSLQAEQESDMTQRPQAKAEQSGWIAWYRDTRLQHIYWQRDLDGETIGFSINGARLLSDLINQLPDDQTLERSGQLSDALIRLYNSRGGISYEWGQLTQPPPTEPITVLPLSHPLGSWRLAYYSPSLSTAPSQWFEKLSLLLLTCAGLSLLGWLLYRAQKQQLQQAEQRVNFVNQVSHELKTPLTNVRMYAELLDNQIDPTEQKSHRYLQVINNESLRLSRLIDNVLSFSRIGRGMLTINPQPGQLGQCLEGVALSFQPAFQQRGLTAELRLTCNDPAWFDHHAVEQIVTNLLSNCEKYAPDSGNVVIQCWQEHAGQRSYIRVSDNGPGLDNAVAEKIFTPFYRVSNKLTDGITGTGIGLSIARDLARSHNGELRLEPSTQGCSFLIELDTRQPAVASKQDQL